MSALANLERFGEKDPFSKNEDLADTAYKVIGLYLEDFFFYFKLI